MKNKKLKLAIIGLGYVGLPLAVEFSKKRSVIGFDISKERIVELKQGYDRTLELTGSELSEAQALQLTDSVKDANECNCFIITVPTPVDEGRVPDLRPLINASHMVATILKKGDIVIYESTVYPGCTEEDCVPVLERYSKLKYNRDFFCGYSPERINPGDKSRTLSTIKKVTSGSTPLIANLVDDLYSEIITAGTHKAESIKIAEASKVIENTQRDVNIAFVNELSSIFNKMGIDTELVLKAAETKWNFIPFRPGLVGGHCIGVDPYYLTHKSELLGYSPELILAARQKNEGMSTYIANQLMEEMVQKNIRIESSNVLIMGLTFKENCPDLRNSRVVDLYEKLRELGCNVDVYDPWVKSEDSFNECKISVIGSIQKSKYDAVILAVAHNQFKNMEPIEFREMCKENSIIYDLKFILDKKYSDIRL